MGLCHSEPEILEDKEEEKGEDETWHWTTESRGLDSLPRRKVKTEEDFPKSRHLECFLDMIRNSPDMQISGVPLAVTMSLYGKVVECILEAFYDTFRDSVCNMNIFGHTLALDIEENFNLEGSILLERSDIDEKAIGDLVDVLLEQQQVNCTWLPDGIERKLYINVISLVFGTTSTLMKAFQFNIAGMQFKSVFEKSGQGYSKKIALKGFESIIDEHKLDEYIESHMIESKASENWIPDTLEHGIMKSVFTLVLYIMKDVLQGMMIDLLGDRFTIRIRPCTDEEARMEAEKKAINKEVQDRKNVIKAIARESNFTDARIS